MGIFFRIIILKWQNKNTDIYHFAIFAILWYSLTFSDILLIFLDIICHSFFFFAIFDISFEFLQVVEVKYTDDAQVYNVQSKVDNFIIGEYGTISKSNGQTIQVGILVPNSKLLAASLSSLQMIPPTQLLLKWGS